MALLERLVGGEASSRACAQELKTLIPSEVDVLFNSLRSKLLSSASFSNKPAAIFGISELVQAHPSALQIRYVEVLELLPITKIGVWAATGHDSIITDPAAKTRLEGLKNTWLSQTANHALKTALSTNNLNVTRA